MKSVLNQLLRIYSDAGQNDKSFAIQEEKLREAESRLVAATEDLLKSSQNLNDTAMAYGFGVDRNLIN